MTCFSRVPLIPHGWTSQNSLCGRVVSPLSSKEITPKYAIPPPLSHTQSTGIQSLLLAAFSTVLLVAPLHPVC